MTRIEIPWRRGGNKIVHSCDTPAGESGDVIYISRDPQQHVFMPANQILRQQVKGWPLRAICFHKWIFLIWEINWQLPNLASDWSYDLVTAKDDGCWGGGTWVSCVNPFKTRVLHRFLGQYWITTDKKSHLIMSSRTVSVSSQRYQMRIISTACPRSGCKCGVVCFW